MVLVLLVKAEHGGDFGQKHRENLPVLPQNLHGTGGTEQRQQLGLDPLLRQCLQQLFLRLHGRCGFRLDGKLQTCGKAQSPEDAQRILVKPFLRLAYCAENAILQICLSTKWVDQSGFWGKGHGVDGEIPPGKVFLDGLGKANAVGPPMVGIGAFGAEGGDLQPHAIQHRRHRAVLQTGVQHGDAA